MIKILDGHCRVAHIGNDSLFMKTVVIANDNGVTKIYGVYHGERPDFVTKNDFCKTMPEPEPSLLQRLVNVLEKKCTR